MDIHNLSGIAKQLQRQLSRMIRPAKEITSREMDKIKDETGNKKDGR